MGYSSMSLRARRVGVKVGTLFSFGGAEPKRSFRKALLALLSTQTYLHVVWFRLPAPKADTARPQSHACGVCTATDTSSFAAVQPHSGLCCFLRDELPWSGEMNLRRFGIQEK